MADPALAPVPNTMLTTPFGKPIHKKDIFFIHENGKKLSSSVNWLLNSHFMVVFTRAFILFLLKFDFLNIVKKNQF